jgi:transposase
MEPGSGHLFLFRGRHGGRLKILYFEDGGFTLWYRRLDAGKFIFPRNASGHIELTKNHFRWLLSSGKYVYGGMDTTGIPQDYF